MVDIPRPALFLAGKAFIRYRRQGGTRTNVLGDFFIGAHAAVSGHAVLTRDTRRYASYFPSVVMVSPIGGLQNALTRKLPRKRSVRISHPPAMVWVAGLLEASTTEKGVGGILIVATNHGNVGPESNIRNE